MTNPDPPINLVEVLSGRTIDTLGLAWQEGIFNGGDTILDYRVSINDERDGTEVYNVIVTGLVPTTYVATDLQYGVIYTFVVESRNSYDYSVDPSDPLSLLCAIEPDQVAPPTTTIYLDKVIVDWEAPNDHGSPITGYRIYILQHDKVTYTEEAISCIGTSTDLIDSTECYVSSFDLIISPWDLVKDEEVWAYI